MQFSLNMLKFEKEMYFDCSDKIKELKKDITSHPAKYSIWLKIALNRIKPSQIKGAIK